MDASNQKMLNMSEEEWKHFKGLEEEIKNALKKGVGEDLSLIHICKDRETWISEEEIH